MEEEELDIRKNGIKLWGFQLRLFKQFLNILAVLPAVEGKYNHVNSNTCSGNED